MKAYQAPTLSVEMIAPDTAISSGIIGEPCVGCDAVASGKKPGGTRCAQDDGWNLGDTFVIGDYYYSCALLCG